MRSFQATTVSASETDVWDLWRSVRERGRGRVFGEQRLHFEQFDQRTGPIGQSGLFEQGLLFDRSRSRYCASALTRSSSPIAAAARGSIPPPCGRRGNQCFDAGSLLPQHGPVGCAEFRLRDGLGQRAPVRP